MTKKQTSFIIIISVILLGTVAYMYAGNGEDALENASEQEGNQMGKVSPSELADGEYYVRISEIEGNPEDSILRMSHVTYFEGEEARLSAINEMGEGECEGRAIEECVPTLKDGYYVRESGTPDFEAPLTASSVISLAGKPLAGKTDLEVLVSGTSSPVFVVELLNGNVAELRQVR